MHVTLLNLTDQEVSCRWLDGKNSRINDVSILNCCFPPSTVNVPKGCKALTLLSTTSVINSAYDSQEQLIKPLQQDVRLSLGLRSAWRTIPTHKTCPWRTYLYKVTNNHLQLYILPKRSLSSFLSDMPDTLPLSSLCLPVSQCQELSTPLDVQLQSGIRVLDVRLAIIDSRLIAYHGIYPQRTSFQEILAIIHKFLTDPATCRETVVMSIKQEDFAKFSYLKFSRLVHEEIFNGPGGRDMWYLQNRIPTLGEVRGKVVMFSRFGGNGEGWEGGWEGLGIHPLHWPNSEKSGFTWECKDTHVRTHDWYLVPSFLEIPEKFALASEILLAPENPPKPTLSITFLSAANVPLALPPTIAKGFGWPKLGFGIEGVNSRLVRWLLNNLSVENNHSKTVVDEKRGDPSQRIRGWVLLDFYDEPDCALVPLLIECNYRGRRQGEEGWQ
ncbi:hypothetical protein H0H92_011891 [Tricholoma furcatifolium]|nr:hypothetical protein H0H92_011891 [Tricholoma furcatifolium]